MAQSASWADINIGAENSARLSGPRQIRDVHFRVEGPVVREVMDAFARDWSFTTDELLDRDFWWPEMKPAGSAYARGLRSGPDADLYRLELILGAALTLAQAPCPHHHALFPARPAPAIRHSAGGSARGENRDRAARAEQPADHAVGDVGHLRFFRHVRAAIITTPPPFDHTKLCTVDGEWSLIGSSNWDARSFRLNFEFDLEVMDRTLTAELDALIDARIATGKILTADMLAAEPLWKRLRNAAARLMMPYL